MEDETAVHRISGIDPADVENDPEKWDSELFNYWRREALKPRRQGQAELRNWLKKRQNLLAAYLNGYGTEPDPRRYFEMLKHVAQLQFDEFARTQSSEFGTDYMWELASAYKPPSGLEPNADKYKIWLERAAAAGDPEAIAELAEDHRETNSEEYLKYIRQLSERDPPEPKALIDLAQAYRDGRGVTKNNRKFITLAAKAVLRAKKAITESVTEDRENRAAQDLPDALELLAEAYETGLGVSRNKEKALDLLRETVQAADDAIVYVKAHSPTESEEEVGLDFAPIREKYALTLIRTFKGASSVETEKRREAFRQMKRAADDGLATAIRSVARFYQHGIGTRKNINMFFEFIEQAAESDDIEAMYECALAYGLGKGIEADTSQFLDWTKTAVRAGHEKAFMALGVAELRVNELINKQPMVALLHEFEKLWNEVIELKSKHALTKKTKGTADGIGHFTNIEALYSMLPLRGEDLDIGENGDSYNYLRLYNIAYVNDPNEGESLKAVGGNNEIIQDFYDDFLRKDGEIDRDIASPESVEPLATRGIAFSVYIGSLTLRTDDLDLWRAYGKDGHGYCIVTPFSRFDRDQMKTEDGFVDVGRCRTRAPKHRVVGPKLYRVLYGETKASKTVASLQNSLQEIQKVRNTMCHDKNVADKHLIRKNVNRTVREILSNIMFLYKNDHFKNEGEVRIQAPYSIDNPAVHLDDRTSKLYVKTPNFLFQQGSKIIIGPKVADPIKTRLDLRHRLDRNHYTDVEVIRSQIGYR